MATTTRTVADIDRDLDRARWLLTQATSRQAHQAIQLNRARIDQLLDERLAAAPHP